ncbi:MAG: hypothetical protein RLZZ630_1114 [Bacteroidota bacterium]|jgi:exopolyphosphatase/guanosine-5'-triphosphate,3'-diphosphate pyrophosphatase
MSSGERIAVIDCGTNTFNLLVGESLGDKHRFLHRSKRVVKIGTRSDPFSPIPEPALARAFYALWSFRMILDKLRVKKIVATGTAALRDSSNGKEFLKKVKQELGFDIRLIPGEREAELICSGVWQAVRMDDSISLIMDIGGGSTEFILCNERKIFWKKSYRLGAARLLAWWNPGNPPGTKDIHRLNILLCKELYELIEACQSFKPKLLVGASGSFETITALMYRGKGMNTPRRNEIEIPIGDFRSVHHKLITSTQAERLVMPGMLRMRADMMVPATLLISFVMKNTGIGNMRLSRFALKEGLFFESISSGSPENRVTSQSKTKL